MFRVLEVAEDGPPKVLEGDDAVRPPPTGVLRWIDLAGQDDAQLQLLSQRFRFHPLTIEDCAHFDQRPKLEEYDEYLFIVTHGLQLRTEAADELRVLELHCFLADRYLVTVHAEPIPSLDIVWHRLMIEEPTARRGVGFICYLIADAMVDAFFPLIDQLADRIEDIEDAVLDRSSSSTSLEPILRLKRLMVALRKMLSPQRNVIGQLSKQDRFIGEKTTLYYRDVYDHVLRIVESMEVNRELLESTLDAYQWMVSQRTNEIVKRLTILSAIFLPLTFITGFFGQNFDGLPFHSTSLLVVMLLSCVVVPATMLWFFLRSEWF